MAFLHGTNAKVYAAGWNITTFLTEFGFTANGEAIQTTTLADTFHDYITGIKSATLSGSGLFDGADDAQDEIINALTNTDGSIWLYFMQGDTLGNFGYGFSGIQTSYNPTSPIGGASTFTVSITSKTGFNRAVSLHALSAETATGNGTNVDNGASTSNGGAGYLMVTAFSGFTSVDIKIQHSVDNSVWVDLITFTNVTAANAKQRSTVTGTVNRHLRAVRTFNGAGPGSATFVVAFARS